MPYHDTSVEASRSCDNEKKYFSLDEANRALNYVRRVVGDIIDVYQKVVRMRQKLEEMGESQFSLSPDSEYEQLMDRLGILVDEIHVMGAELKDFEKGLVDFPAKHDGQDIFYCWKFGEDQIEYWHELEAGFAGRKSIQTLTKT